MRHEDALSTIVLTYGARPRRYVPVVPVVAAITHFAITSALWRYAFSRMMQGIVGSIGNPSFHQAPPALIDRVVDATGHVLLLPFSELSLDVDPRYIIALDSLCWAVCVWLISWAFRRNRRAP